MIKRGIRGVSLRMSLAAAAVVLAGGMTAAVVAVGANHGGTETAVSAGFSQASARTMSYTSALSSAVKDWSKSPSTSLTTISHMKPVTNYWTQSWHHAIIFAPRLGGADWAKAKGRARKAVRQIASQLIRLYSARMASPGYAFGPDTPWQRELEDAFPYIETPDQLAAIDEVKQDMERPSRWTG